MTTDRVEEVFEDGLAHGVADVLLARVLAVLPLLIAAEVEHLGDIVKYQVFHRLTAASKYKRAKQWLA